jgi:BT_2262-like, C-terminal domain/Bacterial surface protein, Ig-like domain
MKKIISLLIILGFITLLSCEKESEGLTRITYYHEISLVGGSVTVPIGGTYTEPGYSAVVNGVDKTSDVVVTDNIDADTPGVYTVTYSATNTDGYPASVQRTVVVAAANLGGPESGVYHSDIIRSAGNGTFKAKRGTFTITIVHIGSNVYEVECMLGAYYSTGSGYGPDYSIGGEVTFVPASNTFTLVDSYCPGWDDSLSGFQNSTFNPTTGIIYWESLYAGGDIFAVTMSK